MKAVKIIKNAKIFTSDKKNLSATALAVKDGKFIMPSIIDSHVHVTTGGAFEYADCSVRFEYFGKQGALDFMADYIQKNLGLPRYRF